MNDLDFIPEIVVIVEAVDVVEVTKEKIVFTTDENAEFPDLLTLYELAKI